MADEVEDVTPVVEIQETYFQRRMRELGVTDDNNVLRVHDPEADPPADQPHLRPIFETDHEGNIHILVTGVAGDIIKYEKKGTGKMSHVNAKELIYKIIRYAIPRESSKGELIRYQLPKGAGALPFFGPQLQEKYRNKTPIETLTLTEGYLKAYAGDAHGFDIVGLASITTLKDKTTGKLHGDILRLIQVCQVKSIVFLQDGDCLNPLKANEVTESVDENTGAVAKVFADARDLYKRPNIFFNAVREFRELVNDIQDVKKYFAHIKSRDIENYPKGLDDLLIQMGERASAVLKDYKHFSEENIYFHKIDITFNVYKVHKYFKLNDVTEFYQYHNEHGLIIGSKAFVFNGTQYQFDEEAQKCKVIIPGDANRFFRVGDTYYEKIQIPNKYNQLEHTFHMRLKSTITDDYGPKIIKHINKYKAFCNVPNHVNYQEVIYSCYNLYFPFEHQAEDGDCPTILAFLKHIFGSEDIHWRHPKHKTMVKINQLDLGLDYIQLLYQKPAQMLPILSLVSKANNTGKSTLAKFFRILFGQNVAIVGNADLANDFNAFWASKLLVICDETKIDKATVVEKVKNLSTADKIFMNAKSKNHVEIDFFAKFIFLSNNEENFIYAGEDDVRYWVLKVPTISSDNLNVDMLQAMTDEIPAFLELISKRQMAKDRCHRAWFDPELIKTEALRKVIAYSRSTVEKELRENLKEMFFDFNTEEILMSTKNVKNEFFRSKYELNYIRKTISDDMKVSKYLNAAGEEVAARYSYPRWSEDKTDSEKHEYRRVEVSDHGRPYVFRAQDFLNSTEIVMLRKQIEAGVVVDSPSAKLVGKQMNIGGNTADDLPF